VLAFQDYTKQFIVDMDASQEEIGAVLFQESIGKELIIARQFIP